MYVYIHVHVRSYMYMSAHLIFMCIIIRCVISPTAVQVFINTYIINTSKLHIKHMVEFPSDTFIWHTSYGMLKYGSFLTVRQLPDGCSKEFAAIFLGHSRSEEANNSNSLRNSCKGVWCV